jgi:dipeptidyl aminopeptidase/acylaminoacyl peptidase
MAAMEPVAFKARDGLALHGYLTRPPGKDDAKNLPMVVYVHGGPYFVRDAWEYDRDVQFLASRGYAVLQVNFRGSGGYGHAFQQKGYREWGGAMQDDVTDATRWAIAQGIADPKRVCIYGASYGGYAALEGAEKEPSLYRCAIGYVGVYDLRLMYTRGDTPQFTSGENYLKQVLGEDEGVLWERSPVAHPERLKARIMLIAGGEDARVPPVQADAMRSALAKAHVDYEWLYQRTEGHGFYDEKHVEDLLTRVGAFLDASLGGAAREPVAAR